MSLCAWGYGQGAAINTIWCWVPSRTNWVTRQTDGIWPWLDPEADGYGTSEKTKCISYWRSFVTLSIILTIQCAYKCQDIFLYEQDMCSSLLILNSVSKDPYHWTYRPNEMSAYFAFFHLNLNGTHMAICSLHRRSNVIIKDLLGYDIIFGHSRWKALK